MKVVQFKKSKNGYMVKIPIQKSDKDKMEEFIDDLQIFIAGYLSDRGVDNIKPHIIITGLYENALTYLALCCQSKEQVCDFKELFDLKMNFVINNFEMIKDKEHEN